MTVGRASWLVRNETLTIVELLTDGPGGPSYGVAQ